MTNMIAQSLPKAIRKAFTNDSLRFNAETHTLYFKKGFTSTNILAKFGNKAAIQSRDAKRAAAYRGLVAYATKIVGPERAQTLVSDIQEGKDISKTAFVAVIDAAKLDTFKQRLGNLKTEYNLEYITDVNIDDVRDAMADAVAKLVERNPDATREDKNRAADSAAIIADLAGRVKRQNFTSGGAAALTGRNKAALAKLELAIGPGGDLERYSTKPIAAALQRLSNPTDALDRLPAITTKVELEVKLDKIKQGGFDAAAKQVAASVKGEVNKFLQGAADARTLMRGTNEDNVFFVKEIFKDYFGNPETVKKFQQDICSIPIFATRASDLSKLRVSDEDKPAIFAASRDTFENALAGLIGSAGDAESTDRAAQAVPLDFCKLVAVAHAAANAETDGVSVKSRSGILSIFDQAAIGLYSINNDMRGIDKDARILTASTLLQSCYADSVVAGKADQDAAGELRSAMIEKWQPQFKSFCAAVLERGGADVDDDDRQTIE